MFMLKLGDEFLSLLKKELTYEEIGNTNGKAYKFNNGLLINTLRYSETLDIRTSWGALFYGYKSCRNYVVPFLDRPTVYGTAFPTTTSWVLSQLVYSSDNPQSASNPGSISGVRPTSLETCLVEVNIIAIGRWK